MLFFEENEMTKQDKELFKVIENNSKYRNSLSKKKKTSIVKNVEKYLGTKYQEYGFKLSDNESINLYKVFGTKKITLDEIGEVVKRNGKGTYTGYLTITKDKVVDAFGEIK